MEQSIRSSDASEQKIAVCTRQNCKEHLYIEVLEDNSLTLISTLFVGPCLAHTRSVLDEQHLTRSVKRSWNRHKDPGKWTQPGENSCDEERTPFS